MSNLTTKLIEIQQELKVPKNQFNAFGKYNYRNCEDILEAVKPLCNKQGLALTISDEMIEVGGRVYIKATAELMDSKEGMAIKVSACARESDGEKGMKAPQVTGSTSSYARKYALNGLFAIDDTKDSDATNKHGKGDDSQSDKPKPTPKKEAKPKLAPQRDMLTFKELMDKMKSATNSFELNARRNKYMSDFKLLDPDEQAQVKEAGNIRQAELDGAI